MVVALCSAVGGVALLMISGAAAIITSGSFGVEEKPRAKEQRLVHIVRLGKDYRMVVDMRSDTEWGTISPPPDIFPEARVLTSGVDLFPHEEMDALLRALGISDSSAEMRLIIDAGVVRDVEVLQSSGNDGLDALLKMYFASWGDEKSIDNPDPPSKGESPTPAYRTLLRIYDKGSKKSEQSSSR